MLKLVSVPRLSGKGSDRMVLNPKAIAYFRGPRSGQVGATVAKLLGQDALVGMDAPPEEVESWFVKSDLREVQTSDDRPDWDGQRVWVVAESIRSAAVVGTSIQIKFLDGEDLKVKALTADKHGVLDMLEHAGRP